MYIVQVFHIFEKNYVGKIQKHFSIFLFQELDNHEKTVGRWATLKICSGGPWGCQSREPWQGHRQTRERSGSLPALINIWSIDRYACSHIHMYRYKWNIYAWMSVHTYMHMYVCIYLCNTWKKFKKRRQPKYYPCLIFVDFGPITTATRCQDADFLPGDIYLYICVYA